MNKKAAFKLGRFVGLRYPPQGERRAFLGLAAGVVMLPACGRELSADERLSHKFRGVGGVVLWIHAIPHKTYVQVTDEAGRVLTAPAGLGSGGDVLSFVGPKFPIPRSVRAVWKIGAHSAWGPDGNIAWEGGTVAGDYTIPVAERIPNEILDDIRAKGGALRIKLRIKDGGILLGWDIERGRPMSEAEARRCGDECVRELIYEQAGGDFREATIENGRVVQPGWYLDSSGRKVESQL